MTAPDHMLKKFEAYLHSREHPHMHAGPQAAPWRIARSSRTRAGSHVPPTITSNGWLAPARIPRASEVGLHRLPVLRQPPLAFHARPRCRGPGRCSQGRPAAAGISIGTPSRVGCRHAQRYAPCWGNGALRDTGPADRPAFPTRRISRHIQTRPKVRWSISSSAGPI